MARLHWHISPLVRRALARAQPEWAKGRLILNFSAKGTAELVRQNMHQVEWALSRILGPTKIIIRVPPEAPLLEPSSPSPCSNNRLLE